MNRLLRSLLVVLALAMFAIPSFGGPLWPDVTSSITLHQTGGPFLSPSGSETLWVTPIQWTNVGAQDFSDVQFVNTQAWVCITVDGCNGTGPGNAFAMTWDNTDQEWTYNDGNGNVATVSAANADLS